MDDSALSVTEDIADARRRVHRVGHRRVQHDRARAPRADHGGPRRISPFFIPAAIINLAAGQVSIRFGARGPNSRDVHGLHRLGARDRRGLRDHQARRCRRDDRRRIRGVDHADGRRRVRRDARAVDAQRRAASARAARSTRIATASSCGEGAGIVVLEELEFAKRARRARSTPRWSATGCRPMPITSTAPPEDGDGAMRVMRLALKRRRHPPRPRSTTSTRTAPRRRSTTRPRRWRSSASSASTRTSSPCRRPSR